jgi:hypothetical protein
MRLVTRDYCPAAILGSSECGYRNGRNFASLFGRKPADGADQVKAILARHPEIAEQHVWQMPS